MKTSAALLRLSRLSFYILLALTPLSLNWVLRQHYALGLASHYVSTLFYVTDVPLLLTLFAWLLAHVLDPARPLSCSPRPLTLALMALVGLSLLSALWAFDPVVAIASSARLTLLFALYLYVANETHDHRWPALSLGLGAAAQSMVALGQFLSGRSLGLTALGEPQVYRFTLGTSVIQIGTERWLRGYGLSPSPTILGGVLTVGLFALLGWGMSTRKKRHLPWMFASLLGVAGLISTFSRAAWLSLGAGLAVVGALLWRSPAKQIKPAYWRLIAIGLAVGAVFLVSYPQLFAVRAYLGPAVDESLESLSLTLRQEYQKTAWDLSKLYPVAGVGSGNFVLAVAVENPPGLAYHSYQPVHSTLLLLIAELGLGGGVLWLAVWIYVGFVLWRRRAVIRLDAWSLAWTGSVVAICLASFFDHYLFTFQQGRLLLWASLGLWASATRRLAAGTR